MPQVIRVGGTESPLYQAIAGLVEGMEAYRAIKEQQRQRKMQEDQMARQALEDTRRRGREDAADADVHLVRELNLADITRKSAEGTKIEDAPRLNTEQTAVEAGVEPFSADVASFAPQAAGGTTGEIPNPPRKVSITTKDGKTIPLAPLRYEQEVESDMVRKTKMAHDANADVMDVPDDPGFGTLAGKKGVRTSTVNAYLSMLARKDAAETNRLIRQYSLDLKAKGDEEKKAADIETGRVAAEEWAAGRTFPQDQKTTTLAQKYMDAHPEQFPRRPKKLLAVEQAEVTDFKFTLNRIQAVKEAYEKVKNKIGPVGYQFKELAQKVPGIKADPDFVRFNVLLRGMNNLEIRRITGAAMQEHEAGRLLKQMAGGELKPGEFEAALGAFEDNAATNLDIMLYGNTPAKKPDAREAAPAPAAEPKKVDKKKLLEKYGY